MKRILQPKPRFPAQRGNTYRPHLEPLEHRLPPGVVLALSTGSWEAVRIPLFDQPTSASACARLEPLASPAPDKPFDQPTRFESADLLIALSETLGTSQYEFRADDAIPLASCVPADRDRDDPALARLFTPTPMTGDPTDHPGIRSPKLALAGTSATATPPASGSLALSVNPANATPVTWPLSLENTPHLPVRLGATPIASTATPASKSEVLANYGQLPLRFEANQGQSDAQVQFLSPSSAYTLFLTAREAVFSLHPPAPPANDSAVPPVAHAGDVLHMQIVGANAGSQPVGLQELPGRVNYFLGREPANWHTDIPTYARVEYPNIYDGISLVYYGNQQQLEYDFRVKPGADPSRIALRFEGTDRVQLDSQGDLLLRTATGTVRQHQPLIYQEVDGIRQAVAGSYVLRGPQQVGFQLGAYDPSATLVIDPVLAYSTYLGGSMSDVGNAIAVDSAGNAYVAGDTTSPDFPTASPMQPAYGGGTSNAFVAKLDPTGSTLLYSTYVGGEGFDVANGISVDATGSLYVVGKTNSRLFPITRGAFEDTFRGDEFDAFVTKIDPAGNHLSYSTYLGGNNNDAAIAVAVDSTGHAFVTGGTKSNDFPATFSAYQGANNGGTNAFLTELDATGGNVLYSTFLGGSFTDRGNVLAVDANGFVYVAGQTNSDDFPTKDALQANYGGGLDNAFVAKLNPQASGDDSLVYSTFLGGSGKDLASGLAVDADGSVYVTGSTSSASDFPIVHALQPTYGGGSSNVFVAKIDRSGTVLLFATYLGGSGDDRGSALALDGNGDMYVTGSTSSDDFPTVDALQPQLAGTSDTFVAKLTSDGSALVYSTYLGGSGDENLPQNGINSGAIAVDAAGAVYVTGKTTSSDFPTGNPLQPTLVGTTNAFVAKIMNVDPNPP